MKGGAAPDSAAPSWRTGGDMSGGRTAENMLVTVVPDVVSALREDCPAVMKRR